MVRHSAVVLALTAMTAPTAHAQRPDPTTTAVVLREAGMESAAVREGLPFATPDGRPLYLDAYRPGDLAADRRVPAIVFVSGTDVARHWEWYRSLGRLAAARGFVGIVPDKRYWRGFDGVRAGHDDTRALIRYLRDHSADLSIDPERVCVWAFSGGGHMAAVALDPGVGVRCLVIYYGALDGATLVGDDVPPANRQELLTRYSPLHALDGVDRTPPMFVARAGLDLESLNRGLDAFVATALRHNAQLTVMNYAEGLHGFDGFNDTEESRAVLRASFEFVRQSVEAR